MRLTIGIVLVTAVAFAAGCGGGGGSGTTVSKKDFIAEADAICTSHDEEFTNELEPTFPNVDPTSSTATDDDLRAFEQPLSATHDLRNDQVDELRALTPPENFEDEWETILGHLDTSVEALANASEAAGNADREGIAAAFQDGDEAGDAADEVAAGYGFAVCGQT